MNQSFNKKIRTKTLRSEMSESTNTSDYEEEEEDDVKPEEQVNDSDEQLEIHIVPDNCEIINLESTLSKNKIHSFANEYDVCGDWNQLSETINFTENPIYIKSPQQKLCILAPKNNLGDKLLNRSDEIHQHILNSIRTSVGNRLDDGDILDVIRIYQQNVEKTKLETKSTDSNTKIHPIGLEQAFKNSPQIYPTKTQSSPYLSSNFTPPEYNSSSSSKSNSTSNSNQMFAPCHAVENGFKQI